MNRFFILNFSKKISLALCLPALILSHGAIGSDQSETALIIAKELKRAEELEQVFRRNTRTIDMSDTLALAMIVYRLRTPNSEEFELDQERTNAFGISDLKDQSLIGQTLKTHTKDVTEMLKAERSTICDKARAGSSSSEIAKMLHNLDESFFNKNTQTLTELRTALPLSAATSVTLDEFVANASNKKNMGSQLNYSGVFAEEPEFMLGRIIKKCNGPSLGIIPSSPFGVL